MVAKVNSGKNILGILNYNENKVKQGMAICISENLYGLDIDKLSFNAKRKGLENFADRNRRATTKAVHISLNFHPEDLLTEDILKTIATTYMDKIGFGNQPYLVYQHFDAAHPHIHIISTNIQKDGTRIPMYNIGKFQSEKARKLIEKEFKLIKAAGRKQDEQELSQLNRIEKVNYGKSETKNNISNIVRMVTKSFKYTSLPELNAVLKQFNVMADRGSENSQMHAKGGLMYRILDENGGKVGIPIKASAIYGKPTLAYLQRQFKLNEALRIPHKERLRNCIDEAINASKGKKYAQKSFEQALSNQGIYVLARQNEEGRTYGITFVDNKTKVVFNGSDLGKPYGVKTILEKLTSHPATDKYPHKQNAILGSEPIVISPDPGIDISTSRSIIKDLMHAEPAEYVAPDMATKRKRKKKRKRKPKW